MERTRPCHGVTSFDGPSTHLPTDQRAMMRKSVSRDLFVSGTVLVDEVPLSTISIKDDWMAGPYLLGTRFFTALMAIRKQFTSQHKTLGPLNAALPAPGSSSSSAHSVLWLRPGQSAPFVDVQRPWNLIQKHLIRELKNVKHFGGTVKREILTQFVLILIHLENSAASAQRTRSLLCPCLRVIPMQILCNSIQSVCLWTRTIWSLMLTVGWSVLVRPFFSRWLRDQAAAAVLELRFPSSASRVAVIKLQLKVFRGQMKEDDFEGVSAVNSPHPTDFAFPEQSISFGGGHFCFMARDEIELEIGHFQRLVGV